MNADGLEELGAIVTGLIFACLSGVFLFWGITTSKTKGHDKTRKIGFLVLSVTFLLVTVSLVFNIIGVKF